MANNDAHLRDIINHGGVILDLEDCQRELVDLAADMGLCVQINVFAGGLQRDALGDGVELPFGVSPDSVISTLAEIVRSQGAPWREGDGNVQDGNDQDGNDQYDDYYCDGIGCQFTGTYEEVDNHENVCNIYQEQRRMESIITEEN